jgi:hypothetical protein
MRVSLKAAANIPEDRHTQSLSLSQKSGLKQSNPIRKNCNEYKRLALDEPCAGDRSIQVVLMRERS